VKVIQACTVALTLILGSLGVKHHAKKKERSSHPPAGQAEDLQTPPCSPSP
jgi:hypothetical protein